MTLLCQHFSTSLKKTSLDMNIIYFKEGEKELYTSLRN